MKKTFLTTVLPLFMILGAISIIGPGCPGGGTTTGVPCDTTNSVFMALYNGYSGSANTLDKQVFEYTFTTNANGSICAIGYQGDANLSGVVAYQIELINPASSTVLFTGNYAFSSFARSYRSITPVAINANQPYLLRRTVINNLGNVGYTVSQLKQIPSPFVPIVNGALTITGTKAYELYGQPAPYNVSTNMHLPCIDFVFN